MPIYNFLQNTQPKWCFNEPTGSVFSDLHWYCHDTHYWIIDGVQQFPAPSGRCSIPTYHFLSMLYQNVALSGNPRQKRLGCHIVYTFHFCLTLVLILLATFLSMIFSQQLLSLWGRFVWKSVGSRLSIRTYHLSGFSKTLRALWIKDRNVSYRVIGVEKICWFWPKQMLNCFLCDSNSKHRTFREIFSLTRGNIMPAPIGVNGRICKMQMGCLVEIEVRNGKWYDRKDDAKRFQGKKLKSVKDVAVGGT